MYHAWSNNCGSALLLSLGPYQNREGANFESQPILESRPTTHQPKKWKVYVSLVHRAALCVYVCVHTCMLCSGLDAQKLFPVPRVQVYLQGESKLEV